jgi:hypothetical protein
LQKWQCQQRQQQQPCSAARAAAALSLQPSAAITQLYYKPSAGNSKCWKVLSAIRKLRASFSKIWQCYTAVQFVLWQQCYSNKQQTL